MKTIGILAGSGQFPFLVAQGAKKNGFRVVAVGFEDNTDPELAKETDAYITLHLGQLGALIDFFKNEKAQQICMAGAISKPKAMNFRPDFRAAKLFFKLAKNRGDDAILRMVTDELSSEGIEVVKPEILVPSLVESPAGLLAGPKPSKEMWEDIIYGWEKAKILGANDIGQCVSVKMGVVVAAEAIEGTDALIERTGKLTENAVLIKTLKPDQDERLDKPSIGTVTIEKMAENKLSCLAFEVGKVLFFDPENSLKLARKYGISIVGIPPENAKSFFEAQIR